jgi:hypothetical protein
MAFRLEPKVLGQLLYGAPLLAALEANAAEIDEGQSALEYKTGEFTHYDLNTAGRRLVFHYEVGEPRTHRIEHVGTYVRGPSAWAWAWSIPQTGPEGCPAVFRVCLPKDPEPGMSALSLPQFTCGEGFAYKIGLLVAHWAGAAGIFTAEYDDHSRFLLLAVFEQV